MFGCLLQTAILGWPGLIGLRHASCYANCAPAIANARSMLADYAASSLDPAIDEVLQEFTAKKKASMPDAFA